MSKKSSDGYTAFVVLLAIVVVGLITTINSCSVVKQRERGIQYTFGKVVGETIEPGVVWHIPFVSKVQKYSIAPQVYEVTFAGNGTGSDNGAVTKDMQTVGTTVRIQYNYDPSRIMDIALRYGDSMVKDAMKTNVLASVKEVVGKYSIYDLVGQQDEVTKNIEDRMLTRMSDYPIQVTQTTITNWTWSDSFEKNVAETANRAQQVKQAEQEALIAKAQAEKLVNEADAKKRAAELEADANLIKAQKEAEAEKIRADAIAYTNAKIAQNYQIQKAQWDYEVALERAKKFDGREVPNYIPLTAAGGIVNIEK